MSEAFRLTLPESDIRLNMLQAAGLTASAMCKVNHSAEFVINLINETYLDVSRCCFKPRQLTITVNDQNMWGKANMFIGMFQAILSSRIA
jgi:2-hydroxychromene-2-carboxylate isomerase